MEDKLIQDMFDDVIEGYELDMEMNLEDMLYEMFAMGFETALAVLEHGDDLEDL